MTGALVDTSVLIAQEVGRDVDGRKMPDEVLVSVITMAELQAGVLAAKDTITRARRMVTLDSAASLEPLGIDLLVASHWASMRALLSEQGLRININDLWIAAVAAANGLPVVTQDADFDVLEAIGGPAVIRV